MQNPIINKYYSPIYVLVFLLVSFRLAFLPTTYTLSSPPPSMLYGPAHLIPFDSITLIRKTERSLISIPRYNNTNFGWMFLNGRQETAAWRRVNLHALVSTCTSPSSIKGFTTIWIHSCNEGWGRCCRLVEAAADKVHHGHLDLIETKAGNLLHAIWRRIVTLHWSLNRLNSEGMRYSPCTNLCFRFNITNF
jgi:hypothetical protein